MNILASAVTVAAEAGESGNDHALMWGLLVCGSFMALFLILLLITSSYSNVGQKHEPGDDLVDPSKTIGTFGPSGPEHH